MLPEKKSQTGILLGVCSKGVMIFEVHYGARTPVLRFPWRETKKISFSVSCSLFLLLCVSVCLSAHTGFVKGLLARQAAVSQHNLPALGMAELLVCCFKELVVLLLSLQSVLLRLQPQRDFRAVFVKCGFGGGPRG